MPTPKIPLDLDRQFEYENGFYLTAPVDRIGKFVTHLELFKRSSGLPGEIIECGVFKGASLCRLIKFRSLLENTFSRKIIGFDVFGEFPDASFEGDVAQRKRFIAEAGSLSITKERLLSNLDKMQLSQNVQLIEGDISETVPAYKAQNPQLKISLLHIDVDLYEPTRKTLKEFFPFVVRGGIVILDDYGAFAGANKAIDAFFESEKTKIQKLPYSHAISFVEKE